MMTTPARSSTLEVIVLSVAAYARTPFAASGAMIATPSVAQTPSRAEYRYLSRMLRSSVK